MTLLGVLWSGLTRRMLEWLPSRPSPGQRPRALAAAPMPTVLVPLPPRDRNAVPRKERRRA
jgi:hypothetical protein